MIAFEPGARTGKCNSRVAVERGELFGHGEPWHEMPAGHTTGKNDMGLGYWHGTVNT